MLQLQSVIAGMRALLRKDQVEQEMDEELRGYLDAAAKEKVRSGMSQEQALRAARVEMGSMDAVKEEIRSGGWERTIETIWQDLHYSLRQLKRNPGFTTVVVITLALGIGINTAIFSLLYAIMVQELPVTKPEELVQIARTFPDGNTAIDFPYTAYEQMRRNGQSLAGLAAFLQDDMNFRFEGVSERVVGQLVSGSYYRTLGIKARLGRTITDEDDGISGANPVAVLSHVFWQRRFGRDPSILGKTVFLNGTPLTVVGVMPPEFFGVNRGIPPAISVPVALEPLIAPPVLNDPQAWMFDIIGRLKPGYTLAQARAELEVPFQQALDARDDVRKLWPEMDKRAFFAQKIRLLPGSRGLDYLRWMYSDRLHLLAMVTGLVLLIACANVATLLLARSTARTHEMATRLTLGASRPRLVRQLLTENLLLAGLGGALGLLFAAWGHSVLRFCLFREFSSAYLPFQANPRVLGFTMVVSLLTGIVFGILPALRATKMDLGPVLKAGGHGRCGGVRLGSTKALVVGQVAASLVLLFATGLFLRTLRNLQAQDPGFNRENVLLMQIDPGQKAYTDPRTLETYRQLLERVNALGGVRAASMAGNVVFGEGGWNKSVWVEGHDYSPTEDQTAEFNDVGPRFFEAVGIPVILGREFSFEDRNGTVPVVLVNQTFAQKYFPGSNPIGRHLGDHGPGSRGKYQIVGVVRDAQYGSLRERVGATIYQAMFQVPQAEPVVLHVRAFGNPAALAARIQQEARSLDPDLAVFDVRTLAEQINSSLHQERVLARLFSFLSALALMLACIALYGLITYTVTRSTHEIGIRMALGADRAQIFWMILCNVVALVGAGAAVGIPVAIASTRIIANQLFGLKHTDILTLLSSGVVLMLVAALAGYMPARRATMVDPMVALRYE